jgi:hypothetical protein
MRENTLTELQGISILTKSFFNKLIRRIESTKPVAGPGITIIEEDNGFKIGIGGTGSGSFQEVTLNVCSNGEPATIKVFAQAQN